MAICAKCGSGKLTEQPCPKCGGMNNRAQAAEDAEELAELIAAVWYERECGVLGAWVTRLGPRVAKDTYRTNARAVLSAVSPHIEARALERAAKIAESFESLASDELATAIRALIPGRSRP